MKVTLVGGPRDGIVIDVRNNVDKVHVPDLRGMAAEVFEYWSIVDGRSYLNGKKDSTGYSVYARTGEATFAFDESQSTPFRRVPLEES